MQNIQVINDSTWNSVYADWLNHKTVWCLVRSRFLSFKTIS